MKKDIIAKLLAQENLTILRTNDATASFDVKNRVLRLPAWKDITNYEELLLKLHEVGHALYTPCDMDPDHQKFWGAINIVEDARIERMIKAKYRGAANAMREGYKTLIEKDFFGVNDTDLNELNILDKINLHFKVGDVVDVPLTDEDLYWVNEIGNATDYSDVLYIAHALHGIAEKQEEEQKEEESDLLQSGDENGGENTNSSQGENNSESRNDSSQGENNSESRNDSSQDDEDINGSPQNSAEDNNLSKTQQAFDNHLSDKVIYDKKSFVSAFIPKSHKWKNIFVSHKKFYKDLNLEDFGSPELDAEFTKFMNKSKNGVSFLTSEFNRRKSAKDYRRSYSARSGDLDVSKVWQYQFSDDIFKTSTVSPTGKNHGFIMYVDWSGSMTDKLFKTVKQTLNLAQFARRINVPFEVILFSNSWNKLYDDDGENAYKPPEDNIEIGQLCQNRNQRGVNLLQVLSSTMTNNEFREGSKKLFWLSLYNGYSNRTYVPKSWDNYDSKYSLSGTPLNSALVYGLSFADNFIRKNRIEKLNVIVLTDGEDIGSFERIESDDQYQTWSDDHLTGWYNRDAVVEIYDRKTHKTYDITNPNGHYENNVESSDITGAALQMYKDRFNATVTGIFIGSKRDLIYHMNRKLGHDQEKLRLLKKNLNKDGFIPFDGVGMDTNFLVTSGERAREEAMEKPKVNKAGNITKAAYANTFKRSLNSKAANKNMLRELSKIVA
jgi:hypothetical protein